MGIRWAASNKVELDSNGERAPACQAYFYLGGTTTPLTVYQNADESTPHTSPVVADGIGRWPAVFIPFTTSYDEQVITDGGTELWYDTEIPNPDPVEASVDSVDEDQLIQTGDVIISPKTGTRSGFVRLNGRTIGSGSSGASERANADCEDLFLFNWNNHADAICAVTGGRGLSAAADWAANKRIALIDGRTCVLRGLDDMGNAAAGNLSLAPFITGDATTGGSLCGVNIHTLTEAQLPSHTHTFSATTASNGAHTHTGTSDSDGAHSHTISITDPGHVHTTSGTVPHAGNNAAGGSGGNAGNGTTITQVDSATTGITASSNSTGAHTHTFTTASNGAHTHTVSGTSGNGSGSGSAHNNVSQSILVNFLQKL